MVGHAVPSLLLYCVIWCHISFNFDVNSALLWKIEKFLVLLLLFFNLGFMVLLVVFLFSVMWLQHFPSKFDKEMWSLYLNTSEIDLFLCWFYYCFACLAQVRQVLDHWPIQPSLYLNFDKHLSTICLRKFCALEQVWFLSWVRQKSPYEWKSQATGQRLDFDHMCSGLPQCGWYSK